MAAADAPRVLIVDDDENYLSALRRVLYGQYDIVTTKDPVQALKIIEFDGPFAVIISDYRMPVMNGIELFSRILTMDRDIQRILITGNAELQMAIDAVNHGKINAFLTKPTPSVTIRSVVQEAVSANREATARKVAPVIAPAASAAREQDYGLTVKEKEVLYLLSQGHSNAEIAAEMNVAVGTIKTHMNNLFMKLEVNSRTKVVARGLELGLIKRD